MISVPETVIKNLAVRPEPLDLGTPVKSGRIEVYFDASDVADAEQRIRNAIALRDLADTHRPGREGARMNTNADKRMKTLFRVALLEKRRGHPIQSRAYRHSVQIVGIFEVNHDT